MSLTTAFRFLRSRLYACVITGARVPALFRLPCKSVQVAPPTESWLAARTLLVCVWLGSGGLMIGGCASAQAGELDGALRFAPYAFETEHHGTVAAEVAFLDVPRRHGQPQGATMRLRVVRLPATGGNGRAAPVVYLAGGPGGSAVETARGRRWPVFERVRREADVLLLDQRGTGLSEPPPRCPYTLHFDDARPLQRETALAALRAAAARCVAHWRRQGIDLAAYTSVESADDIEQLRRALGVPRVSLWGMSYGSHLALATVRRHGAGIDRVALLGVEGPDDTLKLPLSADAVLAQLGASAERAGFADLVGSARRVLEALRVRPARGRSLMRGGRQVTIGVYDAQLAMAAALGRRSTQQMLPLALREAERGDYALLTEVVLAVREQLGRFDAMPLAMEIASGQSRQRRVLADTQARISLFADALNFPFPMLGDGLGLADLGEAFRAPLHSDFPALFVSGTLDGRTPPTNADALRAGFRDSRQLRVRGASHDDELWLGHPAIAERLGDFLAGAAIGDAALDVPPPVFAKSKFDLLLTSLGMDKTVAMAALTAMLVLPLVAFALWRRGGIAWLRRFGRGRRAGSGRSA